jgi:hypothetical protein
MKKIAWVGVVLLWAGAAAAQTSRLGEWKPLFDGKTTSGWRGFRKPGFPSRCWVVEDGALKRVAGAKKEDCGDIVTVNEYGDFEFELEWRISPGGNSGIKYLVLEKRPASWDKIYVDYQAGVYRKEKPPGWEKLIEMLKPAEAPIGFELQLIDDARHPDARKGGKRTTGALYDIFAPVASPARPAGEYNKARILVRGNHVEHRINNVKVLEYELGSARLKDAIAVSKFNGMDGFGQKQRGLIDLQDHDSSVWFRNIRIRELPVH